MELEKHKLTDAVNSGVNYSSTASSAVQKTCATVCVGVLDIAGGRGELSFELQHVHNVQVTLVEPRQWAAWKLSKRQRGILKASGLPWKEFSITQVQAHLTVQMPANLAQVCYALIAMRCRASHTVHPHFMWLGCFTYAATGRECLYLKAGCFLRPHSRWGLDSAAFYVLT